MKALLLSFSLFITYGVCAQTDAKKYSLIHHSFVEKGLGKVDFYITDTMHGKSMPILLYLDGSGSRSLFFYSPDGKGNLQKYTTIPFDYKKLALAYHVVLISKPGTLLAETFYNDSVQHENKKYDQYASEDWRVRSASGVIKYILKNYRVDKRKIALFGYSEGAQTAPRLAVYNKSVTHCIAFAGGGLNQFFDGIINNRMAANKEEISQEQAQQNIDSLYKYYEDIYSNPKAINKFWQGHTYLRWSSFCNTPTIEYYKKLTIPIYVVQGTNDMNTNILSADYIKMEFLRLGKKNLTYKVYPNCDHYFNQVNKVNASSFAEAINQSLEWLQAQ